MNSLGKEACMAERWVKVAVVPNETDALLIDGVLKDTSATRL